MNFAAKLKEARKNKGLTQAKLSLKLKALGRNVSAQQISSWERGDYSPSHKNLLVLSGILEADFLSASGLLRSKSNGQIPHARKDNLKKFSIRKGGAGLPREFSLVEKRKGAISAGPGLAPSDEVDFRLAFRNDWLERFGGVGQLVAMRVEGDSMEPALMENDVVLINKNIREVNPGGGIYAIKWKNSILVKRLQVNPQTNIVLIRSDNRNYETLETSLDDIEIEGKIIWYGREIK